MKKKSLFLCFLFLCSLFLFSKKCLAKDIIIVLDPGHGGYQSGAEIYSDGKTINEKDLNLKIAEYLQEELLQYEGVQVLMTREGDQSLDLEGRSNVAKEAEADCLISLHNNAFDPRFGYDHGCTVLVSQGQYKEGIGQEEQKLGCNILKELADLGIEDQGLLLRTSESGDCYPNGALSDYYGLVRRGVMYDIPSIIIEHAFLDDAKDYENYLSSDDKLHELALADARGIARYFGLKRDNKEIEPLKDYKEKLVLVVDDQLEHTSVEWKAYYRSKE